MRMDGCLGVCVLRRCISYVATRGFRPHTQQRKRMYAHPPAAQQPFPPSPQPPPTARVEPSPVGIPYTVSKTAVDPPVVPDTSRKAISSRKGLAFASGGEREVAKGWWWWWCSDERREGRGGGGRGAQETPSIDRVRAAAWTSRQLLHQGNLDGKASVFFGVGGCRKGCSSTTFGEHADHALR